MWDTRHPGHRLNSNRVPDARSLCVLQIQLCAEQLLLAAWPGHSPQQWSDWGTSLLCSRCGHVCSREDPGTWVAGLCWSHLLGVHLKCVGEKPTQWNSLSLVLYVRKAFMPWGWHINTICFKHINISYVRWILNKIPFLVQSSYFLHCSFLKPWVKHVHIELLPWTSFYQTPCSDAVCREPSPVRKEKASAQIPFFGSLPWSSFQSCVFGTGFLSPETLPMTCPGRVWGWHLCFSWLQLNPS